MPQVSTQGPTHSEPSGPAHSEAPPSDGESESEVNFDSDEEVDLSGLLPSSDSKEEGGCVYMFSMQCQGRSNNVTVLC